jgi:hypothetical protein
MTPGVPQLPERMRAGDRSASDLPREEIGRQTWFETVFTWENSWLIARPSRLGTQDPHARKWAANKPSR